MPSEMLVVHCQRGVLIDEGIEDELKWITSALSQDTTHQAVPMPGLLCS